MSGRPAPSLALLSAITALAFCGLHMVVPALPLLVAVFAGTPAHVAEEIIAQCRKIGSAHFLAVMHWGAPIDEVTRGHEMFGKEVVPLLRKANL